MVGSRYQLCLQQLKRGAPVDLFRAGRMRYFLSLLNTVPKPFSLLDVGGTTDFWRGGIPEGARITVVNIDPQRSLEGVLFVEGDACQLGFLDKSFDVAFSNSVIAHVGDLSRQQKMAQELQRVGRSYFLQTPNKNFPIDWRTLVPFFHWLPARMQAICFVSFPVGRYRRAHSFAEALNLATRVRSVTRAEVKAMFPNASIREEKVLGFSKSFMVFEGFQQYAPEAKASV